MTFRKDATLFWNTCVTSNGIFNSANMSENRKRPREDDACEFMPLSKRINNLHINNSLVQNSQVPESSHVNGILPENGIASPGSAGSDRRPSYDPGINSSDSTYYFDNKLLFELHMERIQRSGQQYPY